MFHPHIRFKAIRRSLFPSLFPLALGLCATLAHAAGFDLIQVPASKDGPALYGGVWTPCKAPSEKIALGQTVIDGTHDCPLAGTELPLIVMSHGYGGSFLNQHDTAEKLADAGFVVAEVNHSDDNYQIRGGPNDSIIALATRPMDVSRLIDYMLEKWPAHAKLDADRIGFYGFSRGGYTGLVLAGADPDFERLGPPPGSPCVADPEGKACALIRQRFKQLLAAPVVHDDRIDAAVIADPFAPLFTAEGLKDVSIPIQLWSSEQGGDGVAPEAVAAIAHNLPDPPDFHKVPNSVHFGFLPPCSPARLKTAPEICTDPPGFDRSAFHADFNEKVLAFFKEQLDAQ